MKDAKQIFNDLGINADSTTSNDFNALDTVKPGVSSAGDILKSLNITTKSTKTTQDTGGLFGHGKFLGTGRGFFDLLSTGEYAGVGLVKDNLDNLKQIFNSSAPLSDRLKASYSYFGQPGILKIPKAIEAVKNKTELSQVIEGETKQKLTPMQQLGADIGQIFLDPTLYGSFGISKLPGIAYKGIKEVPVVGKVAEKVVDSIGEKFIFKYKAPEEYLKRSAERLVRISAGQEAAEKMAVNLTRMPGSRFKLFGKEFGKGRKLTRLEQQTLGDIITGEITDGNPALVRIAEPAIEALEQLGKDAVDSGLLSKEVFLERARKYMPRLYRNTELNSRLAQFLSKDTSIKGKRFLERADHYAVTYKESLNKFAKPITKRFGQDKEAYLKFVDELKVKGLGNMIVKRLEPLSKEVLDAKGVIKEAAYPVAKGIRDLTYDIETAKYFKWIGQKYAKTSEDIGELGTEGLVKLGDTKSLGDLAGKWVPKFVAEDLNQFMQPVSEGMKKYGKLLNVWKVGKTILNPSYHARNAMSNLILNDLNGVNILTVRGAKAYQEAISSLKNGSKYYDEAKEIGLLGKTFFGEDLKDFIDPLDAGGAKGLANWIVNGAKKAAQLGGKFQSVNEDISKLAHYIYKRKSGETIEEALKSANKALFDYGALTSLEQKIKKIIPFYTFQRKAYPMLLGIAVDSPGKIGKYSQIKDAVENLSTESEEEKKWLPSWMRDEFKVRLPFKDKDGKSIYFDMTYILPYGDIASNFSQDGVQGVMRQMVLQMTPFLKESIEQGIGKDLYFDKDIELFRNQKLFGTFPVDSRLSHLIRTFAPQIFNDMSDKLIPALKGDVDYAGRDISLPQALTGMAGLKTYKFDLKKAKESLPYEVGSAIENYDKMIYQVKNDKSLTDEERQKELNKWEEKRQEVLSKYPGVIPKKRIWVNGSSDVKE